MRNGRLFARGNTFQQVCLSASLFVQVLVDHCVPISLKEKMYLKNRSDSQMKHIHNVTLQKTANFSVYNIVADLRRQRMAMVQTKVLCYQSLFFPVMIYCVDQGPGRDLSSG